MHSFSFFVLRSLPTSFILSSSFSFFARRETAWYHRLRASWTRERVQHELPLEVRGRVPCVRERKRGRGGWAWFVFEVESSLHLLHLFLSLWTADVLRQIRHGIPSYWKEISVPAILVSTATGYSLIYALIDAVNFVPFTVDLLARFSTRVDG